MAILRVFVDSDVIISSLISKIGAAYCFIHEKPAKVKLFISNLSVKEQRIVAKRLKIKSEKLQKLIKEKFNVINLKERREKYQKYIINTHDAHIVAGADKVKAKFMVTYNKRHFKIEKIKKELKIIIFSPAQFLQYLRSLNYS